MGRDLKGSDLGKGLSQRKDGRYEARAIVNGVKIDLYGHNLKELKKQFNVAKAHAEINGDTKKPQIRLEDWFLEWFERCKSPALKNVQSRKKCRNRVVNTYMSLLGDVPLCDLKQIDIQDATNKLVYDSEYSSRYVQEAMSTMNESLIGAVANKLITANPCVNIYIRHENVSSERRVLTHEEQDTFLAEVKGSYYDEAYQILLLTGMRVGEFSGLRWDDIDFNRKLINIRRALTIYYDGGKKYEEITTPKTENSVRQIPFFDNTEELLMRWRNKQNVYKQKLGNRWRCNPMYGDLVFTTTVGSPITRYVLQHDLKKVVRNINLKEVTMAYSEGRDPVHFDGLYPHAFRHTFATRCFENGLSPLFVQKIMGHSNYSTTIGYTHMLDLMRDKEMDKIKNGFLSGMAV